MSDRPHADDPIPALIDRALAGDEAAFEAIYRHFVGALYRLSYGVLLHEQDAEEVVQDTFMYAFRNLHGYDPARGSFRTWLYTIAMSRCRNKRRRRWLPTLAFGELAERVAGGGPRPESAAERTGVRDAVVAALRQLSPKLREAIVLRYFDGLTYREMADVLDCPQKTVESRVRLAHEALYHLLEEQRDVLLEGVWGYE